MPLTFVCLLLALLHRPPPHQPKHQDPLISMQASATVVQGHEKALRQERTVDPERFLSPNRTAQSLRVSQRAVNNLNEADMPQVTFKTIQVKQIDDSQASQIRQAKAITRTESSQSPRGEAPSMKADSSPDQHAGDSLASPVHPALQIIVSGLQNAAPSMRATSLSMLGSLARARDGDCVAHVSNTLPQLSTMEKDDAVEVRAQLLGVYCALLSMLPAQSEQVEDLYQRVEVLMRDSEAVVQQAGLVALSQCVVPTGP
jgi:hypothetical protein